MDEKAKELRRAYRREWYQKNKDKAKASNERYWMKKARALEEAEQKGSDG